MLNQLVPLLALSVLAERIVEVIFDIVDTYTSANVGASKRIWTFVVALIIGVASAFILNLTFFAQIGVEVGSPSTDVFFTGLIAGAMAPYSHQIISLFFRVQKAVENYTRRHEEEAASASSERAEATA